TDAAQAAGKIPVDFSAGGAHMMSLSAHKLYGPKGIGALIVDKSVDVTPQIQGGGQEEGRRAGTENVAAIVGFGRAAELAMQEMPARAEHTRALRDELEKELQDMPGITCFATGVERLPNTLQFSVAGIDGETVQMGLDRAGVAVSTGSACHSGSGEPSHVLLAMGVDPMSARGAIRVSFGMQNTVADVDALLRGLKDMMRLLPTAVMDASHGG
ncbi:MAG: aminotransferase class V-fold PLP-dependent enzyme, partial [Gammaproteobacteria bacterium]|nr:aminotransferase class V-fold PLP-dependent enzyme [Gammaproteobacteria bacterium]